MRDSLTYFDSALREILELQKARTEIMNEIYSSMQHVEKGSVAKTEEKGSVAATDTMMDTCVFLTNSSCKKILPTALEHERKLREKEKLEERKKMQEENDKTINAIGALQKKKAQMKKEVETVKCT